MSGIRAPYRAFLRGDVDACFAVLSDVVIDGNLPRRGRIVWVSDYSTAEHAIVGDPSMGSLADLKGKTVGHLGLNTFSHFFVLQSLRHAGLKELDVQYQVLAEPRLIQGEDLEGVEALHVWGDSKWSALKRGYKVLASGAETPGLIANVLVVSAELIDDQEDVVEEIILALMEGVESIIDAPEESLSAIAAELDLSSGALQARLEEIKLLDLGGNVHAFQSLPEMTCLPHAIVTVGQFYKDRGQLSALPRVETLVEPKYIEKLAYLGGR